MQDGEVLRRRAEEALDKAAAYGEDIDLDSFTSAPDDLAHAESLEDLSSDVRETMLDVGVVPSGEGRSGSLMVLDNTVVHSTHGIDGVEIMPLSDALAKYDWLSEYSWKAIPVDADKYTAKSYLEGADGYFVRALAGKKVKMPVQTCLMLTSKKATQFIHNIVIVEEDASLEVVTGCTTGKGIDEALHLGISEMYVKEGGSLTSTMIHNWAENVGVRPRTVVNVEKDGSFVSNYVSLKPVRSVQSYPTAYLNGEGAVARFNSIAIAHPGSVLDMGSKAVLNAPGTAAEIISRTITTGGEVIARGRLVGAAKGIKAHLECRSLILSEEGMTLAIPELEARVPDVEMTHEAAVGKIAKDQVEYLMARGLTEDEAVGMIIRGFLEGGIKGIPERLKEEIDKAVSQAELSKM